MTDKEILDAIEALYEDFDKAMDEQDMAENIYAYDSALGDWEMTITEAVGSLLAKRQKDGDA